jgi:hypothetical protein
VLLAMTILMISMVAISHLVGVGSDRGLDAKFTMRGTRLAESKMAEIEAGALPLDTAASGGTFEGDDKEWTWSCDVQPNGTPNLYQITVTVKRDVRGVPFEVSVGRLMIDPAVMGSAAQAERPADSELNDPLGMGATSP